MKKLKDFIPDIERYFQEDCYCPNEVYSVDGLGFQYVYADNEAKLLTRGKINDEDVFLFETIGESGEGKYPILLNVWVDKKNKVVSCERYEVSKENIENITKFLKDNSYRFRLTEADDLKKEVAEILNISDAIISD